MPYIINRFSGTQLLSVEDGTVDNTTDLKFVGKNYSGYGEIQNENMLFLLENFASTTQPTKAITGQLWFDSANNKLKFYTGGSLWKNTGGAEVSATQPTGLAEGDFWFNSTTNQLYSKTSTDSFVLIGPQAAGTGDTQMRSVNVFDTTDVARPVILGIIDSTVQYIVSGSEFTIRTTQDATTPSLSDFDVVKRGITLAKTKSSTNGVTTGAGSAGEPIIWGSASNALKLGGTDASNFLTSTSTAFNPASTPISFNDVGYTVGAGNDLLVNIINSNEGNISNQVGSKINFGASDTPGSPDVIAILENAGVSGTRGIVPGSNNLYTLGVSGNVWANVHATTFTGTATQSDALKVGSNYRTATTANTANTIAARDGSGNMAANVFSGTATQARYADLAEKYTVEKEHPVGTAMFISDNADYEAAPASSNHVCIGVISENPAYLMNKDIDGQAIALKGRVPVRVKGRVAKGQAVYAWKDGVCSQEEAGIVALVGMALEASEDDGEKLIECVLKV